MVGLVSAMYAGENSTVSFSGDVRDCYLEGNLYNTTGLNFTQEGRFVHLSSQRNFKPDNITVVCEVKGEKEEEYTGGGGWVSPNVIITIQKNKTIKNKTVVTPTESDAPEEIEDDSLKNGFVLLFEIISLLIMGIVIAIIIYLAWKKEPEEFVNEVSKGENSIEDIREEEK